MNHNAQRLQNSAILSRLIHLLKAYVDDIAELRRTGRQLREIKEVRVEGVRTRWRRIDCTAPLENTCCILRVEKTYHRAFVVQSLPAPILQIAQEVVDAAIGAKVLRHAGKRRLRKVDVFSGSNRQPVIAGNCGSPVHRRRTFEAAEIGPTI